MFQNLANPATVVTGVTPSQATMSLTVVLIKH